MNTNGRLSAAGSISGGPSAEVTAGGLPEETGSKAGEAASLGVHPLAIARIAAATPARNRGPIMIEVRKDNLNKDFDEYLKKILCVK
jgi:hypothetical protein